MKGPQRVKKYFKNTSASGIKNKSDSKVEKQCVRKRNHILLKNAMAQEWQATCKT